ncbi:hypothetical protein SETIT_6G030200v2 [Setaria italica]|uniref:BZIP domain-containing protein n=1 Tax=Setaria italica TaxID=4555 RepID=A0A368RHI2_SETIT|nr:uncharacterized protein LOC101761403 isoform X2 [Setaria italica]RCV29665.1 hypothetical protein SETIT_6G030200v2 [Setaria italica]
MAPFRSTDWLPSGTPPRIAFRRQKPSTLSLAFAPWAKTLADMERTTSCSSTTGISSAIVKQADGSNIFHQRAHGVNPFSVSPQLPWWSHSGDATLTAPHRNLVEKPCQRGHAQSFLPPPSLFPPPSGLISGPGSGSRSAVVGDSSPSIHGHATSQSLPSSFFLVLGTVDLQAPVANPFPVTHDGQPLQGLAPPLSSSLISAPSSGVRSAGVGYRSHYIHGHVAKSQSLPSSFFPELGTADLQVSAATSFPAALGGQLWQGMAPPPSGGLFSYGSRSGSAAVGDISLSLHGHATTSQSLPSSFSCTLGMVDLQPPAATPFPASLGDLPWQGLAPQPSWTDLGLPACPSQRGAFSGSSTGQSASFEQIAEWPQSEMSFFSPAAVSGPPLPSSNDNCVGFTRPSSNYELPPLPPSLRIPPLEEASTYSMLSTTGGTMPWHYADSSMGAGSSIPAVPNLTAGAMKMKAPMPPLEEASTYSSMGAGSSIPAVPNLTARAMKMKAPMPPSSSQGVGAGSNNFVGFAAQPSLNSELATLRAGLQAHLLPVKQEPISNKEDELDQDTIQHSMPDNSTARGLVSWEAALKMPVESRYNGSSTKVAGSTPCHNSNSTLKLSQPLPPSSLRAGASSSQSHVAGVIFTDAEKEIIRKDRSLQELVNTDPKRAKRMLSNRLSAAKRKAIKDMHIHELECNIEMLEWKRKTLSADLQLMQEKQAELEAHNKEICMMVQELEQQAMLKDAVTETQQAQIQNLNNIIKFNMQRNN